MDRNQLAVGTTVLHFKYEITQDQRIKYLYRITGFAKHTETNEQLVIYRSLWSGEYYARPIDMFLSEVDREKYPYVEQKYRFEIVEN